MSVTIDIKTLFIILVLVALIVLIVFAIVAVRKLLETLDRTNRILEDCEVVTELASERSKDLDKVIGDVSETVSELSEAARGNQHVVSAIAGIAKSIASITGIIAKAKTEK